MRLVRHNAYHATEDPQVVRRLISENPWAILVSNNDDELVASHCPVLLDEYTDPLTVVTHVGRPDEVIHGFGDTEILLIVQGRHGYISPSWYAPGAIRAPTWNFSTVHCYGIPQLLDEEETLTVLARLVARFERHVDQPMLLDPAWARPVARGTVGLRLPIHAFRLQNQDEPGQGSAHAAPGDDRLCALPGRIRIVTLPTTWRVSCPRSDNELAP